MIIEMEISEKFLATLEVHLCIFLSERRDVSEQGPVSGLERVHRWILIGTKRDHFPLALNWVVL